MPGIGTCTAWWDVHADTLSAGCSHLIRLESGSRALRCYAALVPLALRQTPDHARQVILSTWQRPAPVEVDRRVQVRTPDGTPATGVLDVVHLENRTRISLLDTEAEVHRCTRELELLTTTALDPDRSAAVIEQAAAEL